MASKKQRQARHRRRRQHSVNRPSQCPDGWLERYLRQTNSPWAALGLVHLEIALDLAASGPEADLFGIAMITGHALLWPPIFAAACELFVSPERAPLWARLADCLDLVVERGYSDDDIDDEVEAFQLAQYRLMDLSIFCKLADSAPPAGAVSECDPGVNWI